MAHSLTIYSPALSGALKQGLVETEGIVGLSQVLAVNSSSAALSFTQAEQGVPQALHLYQPAAAQADKEHIFSLLGLQEAINGAEGSRAPHLSLHDSRLSGVSLCTLGALVAALRHEKEHPAASIQLLISAQEDGLLQIHAGLPSQEAVGREEGRAVRVWSSSSSSVQWSPLCSVDLMPLLLAHVPELQPGQQGTGQPARLDAFCFSSRTGRGMLLCCKEMGAKAACADRRAVVEVRFFLLSFSFTASMEGEDGQEKGLLDCQFSLSDVCLLEAWTELLDAEAAAVAGSVNGAGKPLLPPVPSSHYQLTVSSPSSIWLHPHPSRGQRMLSSLPLQKDDAADRSGPMVALWQMPGRAGEEAGAGEGGGSAEEGPTGTGFGKLFFSSFAALIPSGISSQSSLLACAVCQAVSPAAAGSTSDELIAVLSDGSALAIQPSSSSSCTATIAQPLQLCCALISQLERAGCPGGHFPPALQLAVRSHFLYSLLPVQAVHVPERDGAASGNDTPILLIHDLATGLLLQRVRLPAPAKQRSLATAVTPSTPGSGSADPPLHFRYLFWQESLASPEQDRQQEDSGLELLAEGLGADSQRPLLKGFGGRKGASVQRPELLPPAAVASPRLPSLGIFSSDGMFTLQQPSLQTYAQTLASRLAAKISGGENRVAGGAAGRGREAASSSSKGAAAGHKRRTEEAEAWLTALLSLQWVEDSGSKGEGSAGRAGSRHKEQERKGEDRKEVSTAPSAALALAGGAGSTAAGVSPFAHAHLSPSAWAQTMSLLYWAICCVDGAFGSGSAVDAAAAVAAGASSIASPSHRSLGALTQQGLLQLHGLLDKVPALSLGLGRCSPQLLRAAVAFERRHTAASSLDGGPGGSSFSRRKRHGAADKVSSKPKPLTFSALWSEALQSVLEASTAAAVGGAAGEIGSGAGKAAASVLCSSALQRMARQRLAWLKGEDSSSSSSRIDDRGPSSKLSPADLEATLSAAVPYSSALGFLSSTTTLTSSIPAADLLLQAYRQPRLQAVSAGLTCLLGGALPAEDVIADAAGTTAPPSAASLHFRSSTRSSSTGAVESAAAEQLRRRLAALAADRTSKLSERAGTVVSPALAAASALTGPESRIDSPLLCRLSTGLASLTRVVSEDISASLLGGGPLQGATPSQQQERRGQEVAGAAASGKQREGPSGLPLPLSSQFLQPKDQAGRQHGSSSSSSRSGSQPFGSAAGLEALQQSRPPLFETAVRMVHTAAAAVSAAATAGAAGVGRRGEGLSEDPAPGHAHSQQHHQQHQYHQQAGPRSRQASAASAQEGPSSHSSSSSSASPSHNVLQLQAVSSLVHLAEASMSLCESLQQQQLQPPSLGTLSLLAETFGLSLEAVKSRQQQHQHLLLQQNAFRLVGGGAGTGINSNSGWRGGSASGSSASSTSNSGLSGSGSGAAVPASSSSLFMSSLRPYSQGRGGSSSSSSGEKGRNGVDADKSAAEDGGWLAAPSRHLRLRALLAIPSTTALQLSPELQGLLMKAAAAAASLASCAPHRQALEQQGGQHAVAALALATGGGAVCGWPQAQMLLSLGRGTDALRFLLSSAPPSKGGAAHSSHSHSHTHKQLGWEAALALLQDAEERDGYSYSREGPCLHITEGDRRRAELFAAVYPRLGDLAVAGMLCLSSLLQEEPLHGAAGPVARAGNSSSGGSGGGGAATEASAPTVAPSTSSAASASLATAAAMNTAVLWSPEAAARAAYFHALLTAALQWGDGTWLQSLAGRMPPACSLHSFLAALRATLLHPGSGRGSSSSVSGGSASGSGTGGGGVAASSLPSREVLPILFALVRRQVAHTESISRFWRRLEYQQGDGDVLRSWKS